MVHSLLSRFAAGLPHLPRRAHARWVRSSPHVPGIGHPSSRRDAHGMARFYRPSEVVSILRPAPFLPPFRPDRFELEAASKWRCGLALVKMPPLMKLLMALGTFRVVWLICNRFPGFRGVNWRFLTTEKGTSTTDLVKSATDLVKSATDLVNSTTDLVNSTTDLVKSTTDMGTKIVSLGTSPTDLGTLLSTHAQKRDICPLTDLRFGTKPTVLALGYSRRNARGLSRFLPPA